MIFLRTFFVISNNCDIPFSKLVNLTVISSNISPAKVNFTDYLDTFRSNHVHAKSISEQLQTDDGSKKRQGSCQLDQTQHWRDGCPHRVMEAGNFQKIIKNP